MCPIHKRVHDRENMYALVYKEHIKISCYAANTQEKKQMVRLNKPKKRE